MATPDGSHVAWQLHQDLHKLRIDQLKVGLKQCGLAVSGRKSDLVQRIMNFYDNPSPSNRELVNRWLYASGASERQTQSTARSAQPSSSAAHSMASTLRGAPTAKAVQQVRADSSLFPIYDALRPHLSTVGIPLCSG